MPNRTILVTDDDEETRAWIVATLQSAKYKTIEDKTGVLSMAPDISVTGAVIDYRLPFTDGLTIAKHLAGIGIPFVMLTGVIDAGLINQIARLGGICAIKPVQFPQELVGYLQTVINNSQQKFISQAVGIINERAKLNDNTALDLLISIANEERVPVEKIAQRVINEGAGMRNLFIEQAIARINNSG